MVCAAGVAGDAVVCDPWIGGAWAFAAQRAVCRRRPNLGSVTAVATGALRRLRVLSRRRGFGADGRTIRHGFRLAMPSCRSSGEGRLTSGWIAMFHRTCAPDPSPCESDRSTWVRGGVSATLASRPPAGASGAVRASG